MKESLKWLFLQLLRTDGWGTRFDIWLLTEIWKRVFQRGGSGSLTKGMGSEDMGYVRTRWQRA